MQRPAPPPALVAPLRSLLPEEDKHFEELIAASCLDAAAAHERVEVRIQTGLSMLQLNAPVQFGLFAKQPIRKGQPVTPYGGILRSASDTRKLAAYEKTHIREICNGLVLDGLPLANMLDRPTPLTADRLRAYEAQGVQARLPSASRFAAADLHRFSCSALGFMANTERHFSDVALLAEANVRVQEDTVKLASVLYTLPVLYASRDIAAGEEIIRPYGEPAQNSPQPHAPVAPAPPHPSEHMASHEWVLLQAKADTQTAAAEWLQWGQQQRSDRWEAKRNSWYQLAAVQEDDEELWDRGRLAGHHFLRLSLLVNAYDLKMVSQKLLRSAPGEGLQDDHCDAATLADARGCYTVLIYLTAGESTAVPTLSSSPLSHDVCWTMSLEEATAMRSCVPLRTHSVQPGDGLVLSHTVLHHAPRNDTAADRVVLFQHWIPQGWAEAPDSELQRVPFGIDVT